MGGTRSSVTPSVLIPAKSPPLTPMRLLSGTVMRIVSPPCGGGSMPSS